MLNFESNTMHHLPLSVASSSGYIHHQEYKQPLSPISSNQLYLRQPHALQVIQLVECSPPPRHVGSAIESSSASSSSSCDYSSDYSESAPSEEEEEVCTSYCSSDEEEELEENYRPESSTDTYSVRMKRILAWRENFSAHLGVTLSEPILPSSLKRKMDSEDDDNLSHSSKRSRSQSSLGDASIFSLGAHSCPACDKSFGSRQSLLQHGQEAGNEACCVAVEYAFE